jgi:hypothetical protein
MQLSLFNKAGFAEGINSFPNNHDPTGVQLGLVNMANKMNGFQLGIINYAGRMQGTQVGLINIFGNGKDAQTRDGTAIGLLNIGSSVYLSGYASDLFLSNIEIGTGTVKNGRIASDRTEKQVQNALIYSNNPGFLSQRERWAVGYGIKKFYFNRSTAPGMNRLRFISFGVDLMHINHERKKWTRELSLLTRPTVSVGSRLNPKNRNFFFFIAAACNIYTSRSGKTLAGEPGPGGNKIQYGPGFSAGVLVQ